MVIKIVDYSTRPSSQASSCAGGRWQGWDARAQGLTAWSHPHQLYDLRVSINLFVPQFLHL